LRLAQRGRLVLAVVLERRADTPVVPAATAKLVAAVAALTALDPTARLTDLATGVRAHGRGAPQPIVRA